jgi:alkanesulfonate monooxygenase SsuD/methylene tetrahydromethanopterin reductase-like flavin-dependent oxidoreductase (luciferase family)
MRYGFWMPVFGGWLRNIDDEQMDASWAYTKRLAQRAEELGYDLSLIAELNLNDIKGVEAPSLDAWTTAAALAAVTEKLELMVAVRPTFHNPALLAKQAANIDHISNGRLTLNVVSSWWADEATKYGIHFDEHDDRYARTNEWLDVLNGCWSRQGFSYEGTYYKVEDNVLSPKPVRQPRPTLYAGGESETAKNLIASKCDAYLMHGDSPARGRKDRRHARAPRARRAAADGLRRGRLRHRARDSRGRAQGSDPHHGCAAVRRRLQELSAVDLGIKVGAEGFAGGLLRVESGAALGAGGHGGSGEGADRCV